MVQYSTTQQELRFKYRELETDGTEQYSKSPLRVNMADFGSDSPQSDQSLDQMNLTDAQINSILLEGIDEALASLGEPVKNTIYMQLQNSFDISKEEIPDKIAEFTTFIQRIFGTATHRIEARLIKAVCEKFGDNADYEQQALECMSFKEYCYSLRSCNKKNLTFH